jgi:hypothetical protein
MKFLGHFRSTNEEGRRREPKPSEEAEEVAEERERHRDEERECCYRDVRLGPTSQSFRSGDACRGSYRRKLSEPRDGGARLEGA